MSAGTTIKPIIFPQEAKSPSRELEEIIRAEIVTTDSISFARFMELALYHPQFGYYEKGFQQTGRGGDFYTSVSVGSIYGELLAFDFADRLASLPGSVTLVEAGAHDGELARDILTYISQFRPDTFDRLEYLILEPSPKRAQKQQAILESFASKVKWKTSWAEVGQFSGISFSNELLDAMPVHIFRWSKSNEWQEHGLSHNGQKFHWIPLEPCKALPEAQSLLPRVPPELAAVFPEGFTIEHSPAATAWWREAAQALDRGWLMAVDYGFLQEDLLVPERARGTLRAYRKHQLSDDVLAAPGEQDITASVNFSNIIHAGDSAGMTLECFQQQGFFLKTILERVDASPSDFPLWTPLRYRQLASLVHPEHLGRAFKVLLQSKNAPVSRP